jgi:hypothetical protein
MKKKLPWVRQLQKQALEAAETIAEKSAVALRGANDGLQKLDDKFNITDKLKEAGGKIGTFTAQADQKFDISSKAQAVKHASSVLAVQASATVSRVAEQTGMMERASAASDALTTHVADPTAALMKKYGVDKQMHAARLHIERVYGLTRSVIKPYFAPETVDELLNNTKRELTFISACIMQVSAGEAEKVAGQFGAAIVSKITGVVTTGALLTLVSAFGTAGTGTAIASLSGAAATNATLAWVGGLLGGGMAAGAVLTGGASVVVGLAAYKLLSSERRAFESISESEQRIVQSCWLLIAMIDDFLADKNCTFDQEVAKGLLNNTLLPLQVTLADGAEEICTQLDAKNAVAFRQHAMIDFQLVVIAGFNHFIESGTESIGTANLRPYEYVIGGVFYALLSRTAVDDSIESQLVLEALRRSDKSLVDASEAALSDYLDSYDADQLKGIANNIKGIYHEQLWVHQYNATHTDTVAELFGATNQVGADVQIRDFDTNEVVGIYQLKATNNVAYVNTHLERYPDIDVLVTQETAARMAGVHSSGIDNAEITEKVNQDLDAMAHNTIGDRVLASAELSAAIATGYGLIEMLRGEKNFPQSVTDAAKKMGVATAATAVSVYLFS